MGIGACDLDGDGNTDLAIALNPPTAIFSGTPSGTFLDQSQSTGIWALPPISPHPYPPMGWAFACLRIAGRPVLVEVFGNDDTSYLDPRNDAGPQPIKAWTLTGDGWHMGDATDSLGLTALGQWHTVVTGDLDGDGEPDLAVGAIGDQPRVYLNRTRTP
jgi:hypothetical protein